MKLLWKMVKMQKWFVMLTLSISLCSIAISLLWNNQLAEIINSVSSGQAIGMELLISAILLMLGTIIIQAVLTYISGYTCENMNHNLRMWYARKLSVKDITFFENMNMGEQLSKVQSEMNEVSAYISNNFFQLINDSVKFVGTFSWFILLNTRLTLLVNSPVIFILIYITFSSRIIGELTTKSQAQTQKMNGMADTLLTLFPVMKLYDAGRLLNEHFYAIVDEWEKVSIKGEKARAGLMSFSAVLSCLPLLLLMLLGGNTVIKGGMEIGTVYIYINLSGNVSGVLMNMPGYIGNFRRFAANLLRLMDS